jgi:hypothetical protein
VPELDAAGGDEEGEDSGLGHRKRLGDDEGASLGEAVGEGAAEEGKDGDGEELEGGDGAEGERRAGKLEDEPGLGSGLHPGADERDELADEVDAVVVDGEGSELAGGDGAEGAGLGKCGGFGAGPGPGGGPGSLHGKSIPSREGEC